MVTPPLELPFIRTGPFDLATQGATLNRRDRERLALIAVRMRVPADRILFERGAPADAVYSISHGIVRSFRRAPHGRRRVLALLFPGDLSGLARQGRYVNTAETVTAATLFKVPLDQLAAMARGDPGLAFSLLCKATHSLREAQRHTLIVSRAYAPGRVAMFLNMMDETAGRSQRSARVAARLSTADIAEYVDLTPGAVSRALADLESRAVIARRPKGGIRIIDRDRFDHVVNGGHL
jgi:CRP/FNR family transcriptional regulator, anaerobic regulatory protein